MRGIDEQLSAAIRSKDAAKCTQLLAAGANPNGIMAPDWAALTMACNIGDLGVVDALLAGGANVNCLTKPLHWAALGGHAPLVRRLVDAGADINSMDQQGRTPLRWAAAGTSEDLTGRGLACSALILAGADTTGIVEFCFYECALAPLDAIKSAMNEVAMRTRINATTTSTPLPRQKLRGCL